jgi:hypothetical protein
MGETRLRRQNGEGESMSDEMDEAVWTKEQIVSLTKISLENLSALVDALHSEIKVNGFGYQDSVWFTVQMLGCTLVSKHYIIHTTEPH